MLLSAWPREIAKQIYWYSKEQSNSMSFFFGTLLLQLQSKVARAMLIVTLRFNITFYKVPRTRTRTTRTRTTIYKLYGPLEKLAVKNGMSQKNAQNVIPTWSQVLKLLVFFPEKVHLDAHLSFLLSACLLHFYPRCSNAMLRMKIWVCNITIWGNFLVNFVFTPLRLRTKHYLFLALLRSLPPSSIYHAN